MSNEKPVRITVGDVKEVTEATTIKADTVQPVSTPSVSSMPRATVDNSGNGLVVIGGVVGLLLIIIAGYLGLGSSPEPAAGAGINAPISRNAPADTNTTAANSATDTPTSTAPEGNASAANNAPAANNTPAATNEPAANNTPATDANNAPKP